MIRADRPETGEKWEFKRPLGGVCHQVEILAVNTCHVAFKYITGNYQGKSYISTVPDFLLDFEKPVEYEYAVLTLLRESTLLETWAGEVWVDEKQARACVLNSYGKSSLLRRVKGTTKVEIIE